MKKLIPHSTSKHGLNATKQASRGFGGSKRTFDSKQLSFLEQPPKGETEYPLKIESLPSALQWWDDEQFWLIHAESGLRVPGSWTKAEAEAIQDLSKNWNWSVDSDRRVTCGVQLMALAESICKRSAGGEA